MSARLSENVYKHNNLFIIQLFRHENTLRETQGCDRMVWIPVSLAAMSKLYDGPIPLLIVGLDFAVATRAYLHGADLHDRQACLAFALKIKSYQ